MKIVHAATFGNPLPGSFIPNVAALSRAIAERGDAFSFVTMAVSGATWHDAIRRTGARLLVVSSAREAYEAIVRERPDVVHTHFLGYTVAATLAAWATRAQLFWHLHTAAPPNGSALRRLRGRLRYQLLGRRVRRFVAVSRALADQLGPYGANSRKTSVIENAIDVEHFRPPTSAERAQARRAMNLRDESTALVFFGRDRYVKGTDVLQKALDGVPDVSVLAVGLPARELADFARSAPTLAFDRVSDPRSIYWAADALVLPSRFEAAPYTMMEALSCGLPVVASDLPGTRDVGRDAAVRYVPAEDPALLARAIASLRPLGTECDNAAARERFSMDRWVREVLALYE